MKETILTGVFTQAGLFLALAALVIPVLRYIKIPAAIGYLLAGIALGPYGLGELAEYLPIFETVGLRDDKAIEIIAEIGIVLLLFVIGLEITPHKLWQMRHLVFGLGGAQVAITALVISGIAFMWGNAAQVSFLIGLGLALSSTAIVTQWLHEQKLFTSPAGKSSFGILLFQDMAVIPILLLLTILSSDLGDNVVQFVSFSLFKMIVTVLVLYFVGKWLLRPLFLFANKHGGSEVFMALSLLVIVTSALVASMAGLSMALGAFIAGLLLADTQYRHEISSLITPFKSMLLGIFFLSFGMGINLLFITQEPLWLALSVVGLMTLKAVIIFGLCKLWKQTNAVSTESAMLLSQSGEFGLLVVGSALTAGLMEQDVGQFVLITVGITMFITPLLAPVSRKVAQFIENRSHVDKEYHANQTQETSDHIVILGFGRIGQAVAETLRQNGHDILGFDKNIERAHHARSVSMPVYFGDATKEATLNAAHLDTALCVAITLDDAEATRHIVKAIRGINKTIPIIVRAHNSDDLKTFDRDENNDVIAEHVLISNALSEKIQRYISS